ncbi:MAG: thiamine pyrophosphate-binding protein [Xanthobacteraceae bacterium]
MATHDRARTAAETLIDQLVLHGVRHVFCVPGESYIASLDALHDRKIAVTACRHESGAAIMAEAQGKATGLPGICFVTRGPGATNAAAGLHIARQDSTPLILFVGQISRAMREREAFQELDYRAVFGSIAKWVTEIDDAGRIPELISRAFHAATSGRPGPVVIALPEDMQVELIAVPDAPPFEPVQTWPGAADMSRLQKLLWAAKRPLLLLGGSRWSQTAYDSVARFAQRFALPVATTFRRAHLFDPEHACYAGDLGIAPNPRLLARVKQADVILLVGGRLGEIPSQAYTLLEIPGPRQTLVHVHPGAEELGRVYRPQLAINASPIAFAAALEGVEPPGELSWRGETALAHADYLQWTDKPTSVPGPVNLGEIVVGLRQKLPADAIICNGAGNFSVWVHRYWRYRRYGTQLAPISGSMGYGVPAAIGMKRLAPERTIVAFAGDGDFLMTGQEFATAVQYDLPVIVIVADNSMYGTIRMHQERHYPGRVIGTDLRNPDFAAYARAFGGFGATVERTADFWLAFEAAQQCGKPAIIHLKIDAQALTPTMSLDAIRKSAEAGRS